MCLLRKFIFSKCPGRFWAMTELKQAIILFITKIDFILVTPSQEIFPKEDRFMMGALNPNKDPKIRYRKKTEEFKITPDSIYDDFV